MSLTSYLIEFGDVQRLPMVCAVTAWDEADALELVRETYRRDGRLPAPDSVAQVSPSEIHDRIGPFAFGNPVVRGIWYPHINNP